MSKRRVSGAQRRSSKSSELSKGSAAVQRFVGISLSGGKADKACVAVVEYFPDKNRLFLASIHEKIKSQDSISADLQIVALIQAYAKDIQSVVFDVPLSLPKCMRCNLQCPGYEACDEDEITFLRDLFNKLNVKKKPKKIFTPYTERCADAYLSYQLEQKFEVHHALGGNLAPLTARAHFLSRRLSARQIETNVKIAVFRLGEQMKVSKLHSKFHKHSVTGEESRHIILQHLVESKNVFIYQQDMKSLVENNHAFEAFICAYVGFLESQSQTDTRPKNFPKNEEWPILPKGL